MPSIRWTREGITTLEVEKRNEAVCIYDVQYICTSTVSQTVILSNRFRG